MAFDLTHVWSTMSPLSKGIFLILVVMAIASIGVTIERWLAFGRSGRESKIFAQKASPLIEEWKVDELVELAKKHDNSALARLFGATSARFLRGYEDLGEGGMTPVEMARNESERRKEAIAAELRRGMGVIATVGSIAPFVGLLGTVVGIIAAFQGIGQSGAGGIGAVSAGIAEALIETAFGLMVAIPAVIMFNYLTARVATIELALARSVGELLDEMENHYGRGVKRSGKQAAA
jgi:biopolymer transport protein ExbB